MRPDSAALRETMLHRIRIVMIHTTHPGNIGSAARAMKTMGLSRLFLVRPEHFPHADSTALASGAADLLDTAVVVDDLNEALQGVGWVVGTSARLRHIPWPRFDARQVAEQMMHECAAHDLDIAILFGREDRGLTNEELQLCHVHLEIPTNPDYSVLNVAAAMQVVCYEIRMAWLATLSPAQPAVVQMPLTHVEWDEPPVSQELMQQFYKHMEQAFRAVGFLDVEHPGPMLVRIQRLFQRVRLDRLEYNLLRGFFKDVLKMNNQRSDHQPSRQRES